MPVYIKNGRKIFARNTSEANKVFSGKQAARIDYTKSSSGSSSSSSKDYFIKIGVSSLGTPIYQSIVTGKQIATKNISSYGSVNPTAQSNYDKAKAQSNKFVTNSMAKELAERKVAQTLNQTFSSTQFAAQNRQKAAIELNKIANQLYNSKGARSQEFQKTIKRINQLGYKPKVMNLKKANQTYQQARASQMLQLEKIKPEAFVKRNENASYPQFKVTKDSPLTTGFGTFPLAQINKKKTLKNTIQTLRLLIKQKPFLTKSKIKQTKAAIIKLKTVIKDIKNKPKIPISQQKQYAIQLKNIEKIAKENRNYLITAVEKKKGLEGIQQSLSTIKGKQLRKIETSNPLQVGKRVFTGVVLLGLIGGARGVTSVAQTIINPVKTAKGLFSAVTNPIQTIKVMGQDFMLDPVGVAAEFYTYNKALNLAGRGLKSSSVGRYVSEELFIRAQPKQLQPYVRAVLKSSKAQENLFPGVKKPSKVDFLEVKNLNKIEAKALKETLLETDSVVFGSKSSYLLSKGKTPLPKDVDLATKNVNTFNDKFMSKLPQALKKDYIIKKEKIVRKSNGATLLDVKPLDRLIPQRNFITRRGRLPVTGYITTFKKTKGSILPKLKNVPGISGILTLPTKNFIKIAGIKFTSFGEQTLRKGLGTLQVLIEKNKKRAKDPQSFIIGLEVQLETLKLKKPLTKLGKLNLNRKIKTITNALVLLKSKDFARLLNSKVPGLTKEFPLVSKLNVKKLKKINPIKIKNEVKNRVKNIKKNIIKSEKVIKQTKSKSINRKSSKSSKLPSSKLSKLPVSRLSKLPASKLSRLPSSKLSKIPPSRLLSKLSKLPASRLSKLPPSIMSKLPLSALSKIPISKIPNSVLSKLPLSSISKLPMSKLPTSRLSRLPPSKLVTIRPPPPIIKKFRQFKKKKLTEKEKKLLNKKMSLIPKYYRPSLAAVLFDITSYAVPKNITGLEIRPIIIRKSAKKRK